MNPDLQAELPQLAVPESGRSGGGERMPQMPEMPRVAGPEQGNTAAQGAPMPSAQTVQPVQQPIPQPAGVTQAQQPASYVAMPSVADDTDLIEKEWVLKAKQIVEQTKDDPYKQNNEMHKIKAEYIKKRYNKEIKLIDG